jgi:hypothetical protein
MWSPIVSVMCIYAGIGAVAYAFTERPRLAAWCGRLRARRRDKRRAYSATAVKAPQADAKLLVEDLRIATARDEELHASLKQ